jgi:hypothetical protein
MEETVLSYKTTLKAYDLLIRVLVENLTEHDDLLKGELEADESYFGGIQKGKRGRGARRKTMVFGILDRSRKVSVSILTDVKAKSLMNETVKKCDAVQLFIPINAKVMIRSCSVVIVNSVSIIHTNSSQGKRTSTASKDSGPLPKKI